VRNEHLRGAAGDWWIGQRVSRGVDSADEGMVSAKLFAQSPPSV
jgi:hypothetical protein